MYSFDGMERYKLINGLLLASFFFWKLFLELFGLYSQIEHIQNLHHLSCHGIILEDGYDACRCWSSREMMLTTLVPSRYIVLAALACHVHVHVQLYKLSCV